jgi:hypothetical protein
MCAAKAIVRMMGRMRGCGGCMFEVLVDDIEGIAS